MNRQPIGDVWHEFNEFNAITWPRTDKAPSGKSWATLRRGGEIESLDFGEINALSAEFWAECDVNYYADPVDLYFVNKPPQSVGGDDA